MDDARDSVRVECAAQRPAVRDVALYERHPCELTLREDEPETGVVASEVVADRLLAVVQEGLDRPGADAAEGAGHQGALSQAARPGRP